MSWKMWATALSFGIAANVAGPTAQASDRGDGAAVTGTGKEKLDIVDLFAWMDPTGKNVFFILTFNPNAPVGTLFDPNLLYVIHTSARSGLNDAAPAADIPIICRVQSTARAECWVGRSTYAVGGTERVNFSADQKLSFYAGRRNDPYFAYDTPANGVGGMMASIRTTLTARAAMRPANGCYQFLTAERDAARNALTGGTRVDSYAGRNVMGLMLSVNRNLLLAQGKTNLAVWATINNRM